LANPFFPQPAFDVLPAAAALDCESCAANQLAAVTRYTALIADLKNEKHRQPFHRVSFAAGAAAASIAVGALLVFGIFLKS
jgi:hypothetical protein